MSYRGGQGTAFNGGAMNGNMNMHGQFANTQYQANVHRPMSNPNNNNTGSSLLQKTQKTLDNWNDMLEELSHHPFINRIKPYIPAIARFCIVVTFYEDSMRILTQWTDQVSYLNQWKHYPYFFVVLFLFSVSVTMSVGSTFLILRKHTKYATSALCFVVILQGLVYGLFNSSSFILRNFSVIGGLLIAFSDSIVQNKITFGMLPELSDKKDQIRGYLLFAGRIMMVLMFLGFTFGKSWIVIVFTIICTICLAVGFKTKLASVVLVLILTFYNVLLNNYWFQDAFQRDLSKYEFFQNLSIIGGLLLVTNTGAGELSVDSKKKIY
ncbi:protein ERV29 NDAI_0B00660 [Naumovozyma dairenensis CBS 421]|uniref:ER-derived vesicles protein ERV29 n=1 Tax=Naumovozyma dairenensis (strain ATCC 10597 / BCRC 20456 / CBS 421 / NBRC 0211 / NRRL Y-12639) TaxID=1071378 RepID=G0W5N9_NAUDC|nr:hypothetical protein NDAI_0B00660 [Naumovozyma dairenensis CBS 421]CCD23100.1 hypothetical protein NDAI_0B00660 [Naumovozyma dairenensis CBS 421]